MEPLAAQSGKTADSKPGLRRKRLHPGYDAQTVSSNLENQRARVTQRRKGATKQSSLRCAFA